MVYLLSVGYYGKVKSETETETEKQTKKTIVVCR